ncbi:lysophospholipase [Pseudooceanicola antarcticus]|uniref:Lysophospholipase n=1 Tax=Pseudooceanicola antarcticus TaxID=1247613 RepID=A0A285JFE6_9RHOB|nr:lysophospholipase [Pseudooceanicola antarcticus]
MTSIDLQDAPLFEEHADAPAGGFARWVKARDGVRLRLVHWPLQGSKGTVLLFPGRTEYAEKYGRAATDFAARGFATLTVDWRGQGLADRVAGDPALGHVARFSEYQMDVEALLSALPGMGVEGPLFLLAHSMGGCIGLRALHEGLPVKAAAFTAPMWGIELPAFLRPIAWMLSSTSHYLGMAETLSPGTKSETYVLFEPFEANKLTTDRGMYDYMRRQAQAHPELMIGGPTMKWLNEALREMLRLARMPSPAVPCLTFLGSLESIVSPQRIRDRMAAWPGGKLELVEGARHEVMMEGDEIRRRTFDACAAHFEAQLTGTDGNRASA